MDRARGDDDPRAGLQVPALAGRRRVPAGRERDRDAAASGAAAPPATSAARTTASFAYNSGMSAEQLARMIVEAQPCVVLTGAGVSTESGIPDFRSRDRASGREYDPMEYATIDAFRARPGEGLGLLREARSGVLAQREAERRPPRARRARAPRARRGGRHAERRPAARGGRARGGDRGARLDPDRRAASSAATASRSSGVLELLAACRRARDCGAVLKPDVVMFGELLPAGAIERGIRARAPRRPAARRRLVARGLPGRRSAGGRARRPAAGSRSSTAGRRRTTAVPT